MGKFYAVMCWYGCFVVINVASCLVEGAVGGWSRVFVCVGERVDSRVSGSFAVSAAGALYRE